METKRQFWSRPVPWSILFFTLAQALALVVVSRENSFFAANNIYIPPQPPPESISFWPPPATTTPGAPPPPEVFSSLGPILIYFFVVVLVMALVLFLVPVRILRNFMKALFAVMFAWGIFIVLVFWIAWPVALGAAALVGLAWFFTPRVWLHNIVMVLAMVSVGAVFGRLISPWTALLLLIVIAIYDFIAVRFGFMLWLAGKMSESNTLPAFYIPRSLRDWRRGLQAGVVNKIAAEKPGEREGSILGGGDIAFPVLLVSASYFAYGLGKAALVAAFTLVGLIGAYWIQARFLKGRPMPALPPIALMALAGVWLIRVL
jgi:presenilin-like A22 family membrane protease